MSAATAFADVSAPARPRRAGMVDVSVAARRPRDRDLSILGMAPRSVERVR